MLRLVTVIAVLLALFVAPADARRVKKRPTFFIAEVNAGAAFGTGFTEGGAGLALRSTLGVGGAFKGFPARFYLVGVARYASLSTETSAATTTSRIERDLLDFSGGLRMLWPFHRLRILGELTFGNSIVQSRARVNDRESYETSTQRFTIYAALGAQYRLHRNLSLGFLSEWAFPTSRPARDFVVDVSGLDDTGGMQGWTAVHFTGVVHF